MKTLLVIVVFTLSLISARAQLGGRPDTLRTPSRTQKARFSDADITEKFHQYGITEEKLRKLKQLGLDLRGVLSGVSNWDQRAMVAITDVVIIGRVLRITDMPGPSSAPFHSAAEVLILEKLKGPVMTADTIHLLRISGPVTDMERDAEVFTAEDANVAVGEIAVFSILNIEHDQFITAISRGYFSQPNHNLPNPSYWIAVRRKHEIRDSIVQFNDRKMPLIQFENEVRDLSKVLDTP